MAAAKFLRAQNASRKMRLSNNNSKWLKDLKRQFDTVHMQNKILSSTVDAADSRFDDSSRQVRVVHRQLEDTTRQLEVSNLSFKELREEIASLKSLIATIMKSQEAAQTENDQKLVTLELKHKKEMANLKDLHSQECRGVETSLKDLYLLLEGLQLKVEGEGQLWFEFENSESMQIDSVPKALTDMCQRIVETVCTYFEQKLSDMEEEAMSEPTASIGDLPRYIRDVSELQIMDERAGQTEQGLNSYLNNMFGACVMGLKEVERANQGVFPDGLQIQLGQFCAKYLDSIRGDYDAKLADAVRESKGLSVKLSEADGRVSMLRSELSKTKGLERDTRDLLQQEMAQRQKAQATLKAKDAAQAKMTEQYKKSCMDLEKKSASCEELRNEKTKLETTVSVLGQKIDTLSRDNVAEKSALHSKIVDTSNAHKKVLAELKKDMDDAKKAKSEMSSSYEKRIAELNAELRDEKSQSQKDLGKALALNSKASDDHKQVVMELEADKASLGSEIAKLERSLEEASENSKKTISELKTENDKLKETLEDASSHHRGSITQLETEITKLGEAASDSEEEKMKLRKSMDVTFEQHKTTVSDLNAKNIELEKRLQGETNDRIKVVSEFAAEKTELQKSVDEQRKLAEERQREIIQLREEDNEARAREVSKQKETAERIKALEEMVESQKEELKKATAKETLVSTSSGTANNLAGISAAPGCSHCEALSITLENTKRSKDNYAETIDKAQGELTALGASHKVFLDMVESMNGILGIQEEGLQQTILTFVRQDGEIAKQLDLFSRSNPHGILPLDLRLRKSSLEIKAIAGLGLEWAVRKLVSVATSQPDLIAKDEQPHTLLSFNPEAGSVFPPNAASNSVHSTQPPKLEERKRFIGECACGIQFLETDDTDFKLDHINNCETFEKSSLSRQNQIRTTIGLKQQPHPTRQSLHQSLQSGMIECRNCRVPFPRASSTWFYKVHLKSCTPGSPAPPAYSSMFFGGEAPSNAPKGPKAERQLLGSEPGSPASEHADATAADTMFSSNEESSSRQAASGGSLSTALVPVRRDESSTFQATSIGFSSSLLGPVRRQGNAWEDDVESASGRRGRLMGHNWYSTEGDNQRSNDAPRRSPMNGLTCSTPQIAQPTDTNMAPSPQGNTSQPAPWAGDTRSNTGGRRGGLMGRSRWG